MRDLVCVLRYSHKSRHLFVCFEEDSSNVTLTVDKVIVLNLSFNPHSFSERCELCVLRLKVEFPLNIGEKVNRKSLVINVIRIQCSFTIDYEGCPGVLRQGLTVVLNGGELM